MKETIQILVTVDLAYQSKSDRVEAIRRAKQIVKSTRVMGLTSITPKKSKLIKIG